MKKFFIILFSIILVGGAGFAGWYFLLREDPLFVKFYGDEEIIELLSGDGEYEDGESVTLTAEEKEGYEFDSWIKDGKTISTSRVYTFTMSKNTSGKYTAKYNAKEFTISTQNNGVYNIANKAVTDEVVDVNMVLPDGYRVDEMYYVKAGTLERVDIINNKFVMPPNNISIFISIVEINYTITYNLDGGSFETTPVKTFTISTPTFTLPHPIKEGYIFEGYSQTPSGTPIEDISIYQGTKTNIVVYAHWVFAYYSKTLGSIEGSGTIDIKGTIAIAGKWQEVGVSPDTGWRLKELYYKVAGSQTKVNINTTTKAFTMPANNITIHAVFEKISYMVICTNSTGGSIVSSKILAYIGDTINVTVTEDVGYQLTYLGYYIGGDATQLVDITSTKTFTMPAATATISAVFEKKGYTVNCIISPTGGGIVTPSKTTAYYGDTITVTTAANLGYQLTYLGYYIGINSTQLVDITSTRTFTMPAGPVTISAVFEKKGYTVNCMTPTGGTVTPSKTTAYYGDTITVTTAAHLGYQYAYLGYYTGNDTEHLVEITSTKTFTMPTNDVTIQAIFYLLNYNITYVINGGTINDANVPNTYTVNDFEIFLPTDVTKEHYTFEGWYEEEDFSGSKQTSFQTDDVCDKTFYARFTICKYTIKFVNYNNTTLYEAALDYGSTPVYSGTTPTKAPTVYYVYTFSGWSPAITTVTGEATYTAQFTTSDRVYDIVAGQVQGNKGSFTIKGEGKPDTIITIFATPASGYVVSSMYYVQEGETTKNYFERTFLMPTRNITVYVTFRNEDMEQV